MASFTLQIIRTLRGSLPVVQIILEEHEPVTKIASEENKVSDTKLAFQTLCACQVNLPMQCLTSDYLPKSMQGGF